MTIEAGKSSGGIPVVLGGAIPLAQEDVLIELEGLTYLRSGNVIQGEQSNYPDVPGTHTGIVINYAGKEKLVADIVGSNNCSGIAWDGTHFWVLDYVTTTVKQVDTDWTATGTEFSVHSTPYGLAWDGALLWIGSYANNATYGYTRAGVSSGTISSNTYMSTNGYGSIAYKDGEIFITDTVNGKVYKFRVSDGAYTGEYSIGGDIFAIAYDSQNNCFWIETQSTRIIQQYSSEFAILPLSIDRGTISTSSNFALCKGGSEDLVFITQERIRYIIDVIPSSTAIGLAATITDPVTNLTYYMRIK